jgi:PIN domain nuclease of toxin-antitoxin system
LKLLLDSQALLWTIYAPSLLSERAKLLIQDSSTDLIVSHASLWELLGKIGRGKLLLAGTSVQATMQRITDLEVAFLPVELKHIVEAALLPQHHSDPFDRMILAQAIDQHLPILSSDGMFKNYEVEVIWK